MAYVRKMIDCKDCGQRKPHKGNQRCAACYYARYRQKQETVATCTNCAVEKKIANASKHLCQACYSYYLRHGEPRPVRLIHLREKNNTATKDNAPGAQERQCLTLRCANPAMETAPWGLGFCEDCMPRIERMLASHQGLVRKSAA